MLTSKYLKGIPEDSRAAKKSGFLHKDQITDEVLERVNKLNWLAKTVDNHWPKWHWYGAYGIPELHPSYWGPGP